MRYYIFSDSASDRKCVGCSFYIRTGTKFILCGGKKYNNYKISTGETIAIGLGLAGLMKSVKLKEDDEIIVVTDSKSAIEYYTEFQASKDIKTSDSIVKAVLRIFEDISKYCSVTFCKIQAHQDELSENTFADRYAKLLLSERIS